MASPVALFRFRIELADIERGIYESLDFRVAQHPSETLDYLLTRVIAFALNAGGEKAGLEFSAGGLSDPDSPALSAASHRGGTALWIEIGNPSTRKLHKASKASEKVRVYTYKNPEALLRDMKNDAVHNAEAIDVFAIPDGLLTTLAGWLQRENRWSLTYNDEALTISSNEHTVTGEIAKLN